MDAEHPQPPTAECSDALVELERFLDGELDDAERRHVLAHLDACIECFHTFDFQAELKLIVATKCGNDPMPPDLVERLRRVCQGEAPDTADAATDVTPGQD